MKQHGSLEPDAPNPDGSDRLAVYTLTPAGTRRRIAETSVEGVGLTLLTLHAEGEFEDGADGRALRVGLFDRATREWIVSPWVRASR